VSSGAAMTRFARPRVSSAGGASIASHARGGEKIEQAKCHGIPDFHKNQTERFSRIWVTGDERGDRLNQRWIVDTTVLYTGIDKVTLAVNFDFAGEEHDPALVALGTPKDTNSSWSGIADYAGYDWTKALRTVLRLEYFADPQDVLSSETIAPGHNLDLWEVTATVEYKVWRGFVGPRSPCITRSSKPLSSSSTRSDSGRREGIRRTLIVAPAHSHQRRASKDIVGIQVRRAVCPRSRVDRARPAGRLHDNAFEFSISAVAADFFAT